MSDTTNWTCPACGQPRSSLHACPADSDDHVCSTGEGGVCLHWSHFGYAAWVGTAREVSPNDPRTVIVTTTPPPASPADRDRATARSALAMSGIDQCWCDVTHDDGCPTCRATDLIAAALTAARAEGFEAAREACAKVVREVALRPRTGDVLASACAAFDEAEAEIRGRKP